jgi:uncharacterized protein (TIGR03067 family)
MRLRPCAVLLVGLLLAAAPAKDDGAQQEMKKFEGTWVSQKVELDGQTLEDQAIVTMTGDKYVVKVNNETREEGTFKLDPIKKPKAIDSSATAGPGEGKMLHGIYELKGDDLKICLAIAGKDRPTEFSAGSGSGHMLYVFKRDKK